MGGGDAGGDVSQKGELEERENAGLYRVVNRPENSQARSGKPRRDLKLPKGNGGQSHPSSSLVSTGDQRGITVRNSSNKARTLPESKQSLGHPDARASTPGPAYRPRAPKEISHV